MERMRADSDLDVLTAKLPTLRGELHRYLARMTGSVVEGEDVLQDALLAATTALRNGAEVQDMRAWLFRIAHNTALNLFRSRKREAAMKEQLSILPSPSQPDTPVTLHEALTPYLALTPNQRSIVILRDVLGYTAAEVAELTQSSVSAVKSALHRGRAALSSARAAHIPDKKQLADEQIEALHRYANLFNAHDFDALREMLGAEVRLELVSVDRREGKAHVSGYFNNYSKRHDWHMAPGIVEGRPAILASDRDEPRASPSYFILLELEGSDIRHIRDFRYARYSMADADWSRI